MDALELNNIKRHIIYKIYYKLIPTKCYVGRTSGSLLTINEAVEKRFKQHKYLTKQLKSKYSNHKLYRFMQSNGIENFEIEKLDIPLFNKKLGKN